MKQIILAILTLTSFSAIADGSCPHYNHPEQAQYTVFSKDGIPDRQCIFINDDYKTAVNNNQPNENAFYCCLPQ